MPTNTPPSNHGEYPPASGDIVNYPESGPESAEVGYETTDVNVGGIIVFLGGLMAFILIFFGFCFVMGRAINSALNTQDGSTDKWHQTGLPAPAPKGRKGEDLENNPAMEQKEFARVTTSFPNPRLDIDDGNQGVADLHAREDLLLEHYSGEPGSNQIRIPIERAMELIAQRGLPVSPAGATATEMAGDNKPVITAPLTSGFARTGYELDVIEAREQQLEYKKAAGDNHASLQTPPVR